MKTSPLTTLASALRAFFGQHLPQPVKGLVVGRAIFVVQKSDIHVEPGQGIPVPCYKLLSVQEMRSSAQPRLLSRSSPATKPSGEPSIVNN